SGLVRSYTATVIADRTVFSFGGNGDRTQNLGPRWRIELQPWAGPAQSLEEEASRFLSYISTTQVVFPAEMGLGIMSKIACDHMGTDSLAADSSPATKPWLVCLDDRFGLAHQIRSKQCRLYSLGLGNDDTHFEVRMANDGCEVHHFDPSVKSAHVLESQRLWHHRLSIDWRDPHPAVAAQKLHSNTRKLGSILNEFGHHKFKCISELNIPVNRSRAHNLGNNKSRSKMSEHICPLKGVVCQQNRSNLDLEELKATGAKPHTRLDSLGTSNVQMEGCLYPMNAYDESSAPPGCYPHFLASGFAVFPAYAVRRSPGVK
ncbi:hypothetical protein STEG23_027454, partial [Scotinomys teguina]